jgi:hypothetical protein
MGCAQSSADVEGADSSFAELGCSESGAHGRGATGKEHDPLTLRNVACHRHRLDLRRGPRTARFLLLAQVDDWLDALPLPHRSGVADPAAPQP